MTAASEPPVSETEIHRGRNHRVLRVLDPVAGPLIVKRDTDDSGGGAARSALHNEQRILRRLQGLGGCPHLVHFDAAKRELAVADFGGVTLRASGLLGTVDLVGFLALSEALARKVAAIHGRGVIHQDLNPANILVRPDELRIQLIDFALASTFAEQHPAFGHPSQLLGNPTYLSPEQTGRMNRPIDYRTDLYSLGATLYTLATGVPPFEDTDPLLLLHAHLARAPRPPDEQAPWLPPRLSEVILTLLAKEPDDRYQSAAGLAYDLQQLRQALTQQRPLTDIRLRERDLPLVPRPPHHLYGRDAELATLLAALANVTHGGSQGLFVAGYSGVGKTSLIHEMHRPVTLGQGLFISGKFEQYQRERPFLAPAQGLRQLCQLLLVEPDTALAQWRERILAGVGPDAGALFEVVPELAALLGPQPPVPELGPIESQIRLRTLLVALVRQIAAPAHPLVLFLDDLQWADAPSLDFIDALLDETTLDGLLLIGAYRDNEVDPAHPLLRRLRRPTAAGTPPQVLSLSSLTVADLDTLVADMLHTSPHEAHPLAAALYAKTSGNPFFTIEFINKLQREGGLYPDPEQGRWRWDTAAVAACPVSANVVDFLRERLTEWAPPTAEALVAAACLGNACTLGLLALATGARPLELADRLLPALERGILITPGAAAFHRAEPAATLRFCHDRMQQAAYELRDDTWRQQLHLAMARRFAQVGTDPGQRFAAAQHYAAAAPLLVDPAEQAAARGLFLNAAIQTRRSGAFAAAEHFLRLGIALLAPDWSEEDSDAAFTLHAELHLVLYSQSHHADADAVYAQLAAHARSPVQLVEPACIQIASLSNRTCYAQAVSLAGAILEPLGVTLPQEDLPARLEQEMAAFYRHVDEGALERLPGSPTLGDEGLLGAAALMNRVLPAAFFKQPMLALWVALRVLRLSIEHGFCTAMLYSASSVIVGTVGFRGDYATGYRAACMALTAGLAREHGIETARVQYEFALLNCHWFKPLAEGIAYARTACDGLLRGGDLEIGCFTFFATQAALLDTCAQLAELNAETHAALSFARKTGNQHAEQSYLSYRQLVRALEGRTAHYGGFDDAEFDTPAHLLAIAGNAMAQCYFHLQRALSACLFNDAAALIRHAEAGVALTPNIACFYPTALANLLHSLALICRIKAAPEPERPALHATLAGNQAWLRARAADAPMNFDHLEDLVEAERLDALDQPWAALQRFEQAMRKSQAHQRPWHHALSTERAGRFHMRHGQEYAGRALLTRAHELWRDWGAEGKARAMRDELSFVHTASRQHVRDSHPDALDHEALRRASQALAAETSLPRLVARVLALLGQLTGATDAWLLVMDDAGHWNLEGGIRGAETLGRMSLPAAEDAGLVAASVLRLGLKTLLPLVCDDAVLDTRFQGDRHFAGLTLCSLLALPVVVQGRLTAFLALENRLLRAAFPAQRVETVSMLCGQLAVSIENVRLDHHKQAAALAQRQTVTDRLTGMANRLGLEQRLRELADGCAPNPLTGFTLLLIDFDDFKRVNHGFGWLAGDTILKIAAHRVATCLDSADLVARLEADRFALALPTLQRGVDAQRMAERVLLALRQPYFVAGAPLQLTVSLGLAFYPQDADGDLSTLLLHADLALAQVKAEGGNGLHLFDPVLAATAQQRRRLEDDLRQAIAQQQLAFVLQPIVDLQEGRVAGAEALVRWEHPERGTIQPDEFIPLAEETALISDIGRWMLDAAGRQLARWQAQGDDLYLSLNVSGRQIPDGLPPQALQEAAHCYGFAPAALALEITEGILLNDFDSIRNWLMAVRELGFRVYLDDFGTGYSSLSYLKHFRVDCMKIDQSFVRDMADDVNDRALVEAVVAIARSLRIAVIAEGVEQPRQVQLLHTMGCRYAQGYYFSRPARLEAFPAACAQIPDLLRAALETATMAPRQDP